jgi:hypothetical protein
VVEAVLRAVRLGRKHGEEVAHGLHLPHGLRVEQPRLDALCVYVCVFETKAVRSGFESRTNKIPPSD